MRLFAERGYEATSTRAVAVAADVSSALVTHHFGSKEGLRAAVEQEVLSTFNSALSQLDSHNEPSELLSALGGLSARLFGEDPIRRAYLRRALLEQGPTSSMLFERLLNGARRELERLESIGSRLREGADTTWAPYQLLFLILGPLLLEPAVQPTLDVDLFAPEVVKQRSEANQRLLSAGLIDSHLPSDRSEG
jgi:AcrR family transcriptional regulator